MTMKIIIYENTNGELFMGTPLSNRFSGVDTKMHIPPGYTFIYSGENLPRTLIKLSNKLDIDHYEIRSNGKGKLQGYYIANSVIDEYKIKNDLDDINSLT